MTPTFILGWWRVESEVNNMKRFITISTGTDDVTRINLSDLCGDIIKSVTEPSLNVPKVPMMNRFGMKSSIFVMDKVPNKYIVRPVGVLDFWNEIEGFFLVNSHIPTYDMRREYWDLPEDIKFSNLDKIRIGEYVCTAVGDRIVDNDYNVYKVVGFINSDGKSEVYFDIK